MDRAARLARRGRHTTAIPLEAIDQPRRFHLVEIDAREQHSSGLDAHLNADVRDFLCPSPELLEDLMRVQAGLEICGLGIMGQPVVAPVVVHLVQFGRVPVERLEVVLEVADHPQIRHTLLCQDDGHRVVEPQVPYRMHFQSRIIRNWANPLRLQCLGDFLAVDRPGHGRSALTFPYIPVVVLVGFLAMLALSLEHGREPRVIVPIDLLHPGIRRRILDKPLPHRVGIKLRIEAHPYFRIRFPNRRNQDIQGPFRNGLSLFNPAKVGALERLD